MILLADVGNSRIKWMSGADDVWPQHGQASHGDESWAELAGRLWSALPRPTRVLIVSVAGPEARAGLAEERRAAQPVAHQEGERQQRQGQRQQAQGGGGEVEQAFHEAAITIAAGAGWAGAVGGFGCDFTRGGAGVRR